MIIEYRLISIRLLLSIWSAIFGLFDVVSDTLSCERFVGVTRDDVQVGVRVTLTRCGFAVPADAVAIGIVLFVEHMFGLFEKALSFDPLFFCQIERGFSVRTWENHCTSD